MSLRASRIQLKLEQDLELASKRLTGVPMRGSKIEQSSSKMNETP